jgi:trafficking protein particle complex subunit 9
MTVENVSALMVDFVHLAFDDSTIAPAQQALSEGDMSVFDTYETEYDLIHRPMFTWDKADRKTVPPGDRLTLSVVCEGKAGWYEQTPPTV